MDLVLSDAFEKTDFFRYLIRQYRSEEGYRATHSVDIFGKTVIEDNRGKRVEMGTDYFGNRTYKERSGDVETSVKRSIRGVLEYRSGSETASLGKDVLERWIYKDSSGNKFEFGARTWETLIRRFGSDENIFWFLIDEFLRN